MNVLPIALHGASLRALVVGGGAVAARKVESLLDAGATVRVVAPRLDDAISMRAPGETRLMVEVRRYREGDVGDAQLVVAATDDRAVNARVAADSRAAHRLVIVTDRADEGNCRALAVHRAGALTIAVSAAGVPTVAMRVRDSLAARFDRRYDDALQRLQALRGALLGRHRRSEWHAARAALIGDDFCEVVESGGFGDEVARWR